MCCSDGSLARRGEVCDALLLRDAPLPPRDGAADAATLPAPAPRHTRPATACRRDGWTGGTVEGLAGRRAQRRAAETLEVAGQGQSGGVGAGDGSRDLTFFVVYIYIFFYSFLQLRGHAALRGDLQQVDTSCVRIVGERSAIVIDDWLKIRWTKRLVMHGYNRSEKSTAYVLISEHSLISGHPHFLLV